MSFFTDMFERLRTLVFRKREERELEEELRFHLAMESEHLRNGGATAAQANKRSVIALGGLENTKEDVRDARGTRLLEDSAGDITLAVRSLRKSPAFAFVAILTLAIGIGATTAVYSVVDAVLLQPLPYAESGQLVRLYQRQVGSTLNNYVTPVHYLDYRSDLASMESVAAVDDYHATSADVGGSDHPERIRLLPVSAQYWNVLRVQPAIGRGFESAEEDNALPSVVLSHELFVREFSSNGSAIGASFLMSGKSYTVVGVMPEGFVDPLVKHVDAWVPINLTPGRSLSNTNNHYFSVLARVREPNTIAQAQAELDKLSLTLAAKYDNGAKDIRATLQPLKQDIVAPASRSLTLMLGAVALVLLLVCVNIANLLLVRGSERAREFALRTALGAQRSRLIRQLLVESLTLAVAGSVAGLVVARVAMTALVRLGGTAIPRLSTLTLEPRLLLFAVGISSLCAVVFGLAPALRTTRLQPSDVLRDASRSATGGRSQGRVREALVVSQVAIAFAMLIGASLLLASFRQLQRVETGVRTANVLTFELQLPSARYDSTARADFYERFANEAMKVPGVVAVGGVSKLPATGDYNVWGTRPITGPIASTFRDMKIAPPQQRVVSGQYFRAVGIRLLQGRVFNAGDGFDAPKRAVISQEVAEKYFPGTSALGQHIETADGDHEVIGVVSDVSRDAEGDMAPTVYHAHTQFAGDRNWELSQTVLASGNPMALIVPLRQTLATLDAQLVMYQPNMLTDVIGQGVATRVFTLRVVTVFAVVALMLAALGLYGVLSYSVKLRTREFGIRMALGANRHSIRNMVLKRGLQVASVGVVIGLAGAVALSGAMRSLVFQVNPLDPVVICEAALFMAIVAGFAAYIPAYRATIADPRQALSGE
jgi:putative ABC transport system permease protein